MPKWGVSYPVEADQSLAVVDLAHGFAGTSVVIDLHFRLHLQTFLDDIDGQPEYAGEELGGEA